MGVVVVATQLAAHPEGPAPKSNPPPIAPELRGGNVVMIVIDTLRADHLGSYGYHRDTSPFIDSLANRGILFENSMSTAPYTPQSIASLMSGVYPSRGGHIGLWPMPMADRKVLPEYFSDAGYKTGMSTDQFIITGYTKYFDESHVTPVKDVGPTCGTVTERALALSEKFGKDPFFLYVHYIDPHALYTPPDENYRKFQPNPIPLPQQLSSFWWAADYDNMVRQGIVPGNPGFDDMVSRYDAEIATVDRSVQTLIETMRDRGQLDNALVILTSDHGEEFFEHEYTQHSWTLFRESIHVPLIFWSPKIEAPQRVAQRVSLVDVLPSVLSLYGMPFTSDEFDGHSLFARDGAAFRAAPENRPIIAEFVIYEKTVQRAVMFDDFKLYTSTLWWEPSQRSTIDHSLLERAAAIHDGSMKAPHLWRPWQKTMLFNLRNDPEEKLNIAETFPDKVRLLDQIILRYRRSFQAGRGGTGKKLEGLGNTLTPGQIERLKALGYL